MTPDTAPPARVPEPESGREPGDGARTASEAPQLAVIVLSWNSKRFLEDCLTSALAQTDVRVEVIVVDNGSTDGSGAFIRDRFPGARLLELGDNLGFCAANNCGLALTRAPFVLFANSDIILDPRFAARALAAFAGDPRIGIVAGKLLRFDRVTIDSAGQFLTRSRRVVERGYGEPDAPEMNEPGYVFSACGAALVCRREMIDDVSVAQEFFDASFFAFSEDLDVGWRARLAGWRAYYDPSAVAFHYRGGSEAGEGSGRFRLPAIVRRSPALRFHILKNRRLMILKNDAAGAILRDLPFIVARDAGLLLLTLVTSPRLLVTLVGSGALRRAARERRRRFLADVGRWGARRPGVSRAWVRWTRPTPQDQEGP